MLLNTLEIEAVRGIRNRVNLPLDASLTVLLAANGTAKTSVCDAAEWLLTGRIRRLQAGLVSASEILNRYAESARPLVRANATWVGESRNIERTDPERIQTLDLGGATIGALSTGEFLEQITPDYVGQTARSRNVDDQRAEWLRAVRFFNPDGLGLLLDDEENAERVRAIAFAELLGIGPVGRRIKGLQGVRTRIDSRRAELADVRKQIGAFQDRLTAAQASASEPHLLRVDSVLREVAAFCKLTLPDLLLKRRDVLLTLKDRIASIERTFESQRSRHARVQESFSQYQSALILWDDWTKKQKPDQEKALSEAQKHRDDTHAEVARLAAVASETMNQLGQINTVLGEAQTTVAIVRLNLTSHDDEHNLTIGRFRAACEDLRKGRNAANAEVERWRVFVDKFPEAERNFLQVDSLERQRLELSQSVPSPEDQALVEHRLRECNISLAELRTQLKTTANQSQRWVTEVKTQLPNWTERSACPLCGHDYKTNDDLRNAMVDALAKQPSSDANAVRRVAELEASIKELQFKAASTAERQKQLLALESKLASQREAHVEALAAAQERGFDEQLFMRVDALTMITARLDLAREQANAARTKEERLSARLTEVEGWHSQLQSVGDKLCNSVPIPSTVTGGLVADPSLEERLRHVGALITFAEAEASNLRKKNDETIRLAQEIRGKLESAESTLHQLRDVYGPLATSAAETRTRIDALEESWRALSGEVLNESSLSRVADMQRERSGQIQEQIERLRQAEQHLNLAEQAVKDEADRSEASRSITRLKTEEEALIRIELLRTRLDSAIEGAQKNLNQLLTWQIRPLLRAISSFYLRTQGNAFIDSIDVDDTSNENVLRWLGRLVDAKPLAAVEMSQGQRQDLALSIFLARARRERGSFVLDEPLAHLDDLNRVAFFDTLRAMVTETKTDAGPFRMLVTTASRSLVRHLRAKFVHVRKVKEDTAFRILELAGDPRTEIEIHDVS